MKLIASFCAIPRLSTMICVAANAIVRVMITYTRGFKLVVAVYARHQEFHCTLEELWDGSIDYTFMLVVKSSIAHLKNYGFILTAGVGVDGVFCTVRRQENMGGIEANCERNCGITSKPSVGRENSMIAASDVR